MERNTYKKACIKYFDTGFFVLDGLLPNPSKNFQFHQALLLYNPIFQWPS